MDALVVVHAEWYNRKWPPIHYDIAREMGLSLDRGERVYYLAEEVESPESKLICPAIRAHFPQVPFLPLHELEPHLYPKQYLRLKKRLMEEEVTRTALAGQAHDCCVWDVYLVLTGQVEQSNLEDPEDYKFIKHEDYVQAVNELGWPQEEFDDIFQYGMDTCLINRLIC